jgi:hypothetical protein
VTSPQTLAAIRPPARNQMQALLAKPWVRPFVPSVPDLFFIAFFVWVFLSGPAGWQGLLVDGDIGWHIRTGDYILEHHAVPHRDLYSWSKPDAPWYAWEWLSDVLFAGAHRAAGLKGVVLLAGVTIAVFATTLLRRILWRGAHLFIALLISLMAIGSASIHFLARPHVFTLLLLSLSVWTIEADRRTPTRRIWWLVPVTIVWTNLHGGFLALIAFLALTAVGTAVEALVVKTPGRTGWRPAARYGALTALCFAGSFVNPYGWRLHQHVIEYLRSDWIKNTIQEFKSPSFRDENMLQFEVLLLVGLMVAGLMFKRKQVAEGLWVLFFAHSALISVRHVPIFATVTAPLIAQEIGSWWTHWSARMGPRSLGSIVNQMSADFARGVQRLSLWPVVFVAALVFVNAPIHWPTDFPDEFFPTAMIHAHAAELAGARIITTDQWGDYLIYLHPGQKVFVDGRSDFYGPEIGNQTLHLVEGGPQWEQTLERHHFTVALLPVQAGLAQLLKQRADWRIAEDDGKHIVLVRKVAPVPPTGNMRPEPRF